MSEPTSVYHYCDTHALRGILQDQCIHACVDGCDQDSVLSQYVWFSGSPFWEPTCRVAGLLEPEGFRLWNTEVQDFVPEGAARIVFPRCLVRPWEDVFIERGVSSLEIFFLAHTGIDVGADPADWYVTKGAMPIANSMGIQIYDYDRWKVVTPEQAITELEYTIRTEEHGL